jgi:hypothetical protein
VARLSDQLERAGDLLLLYVLSSRDPGEV